MVKIILGVIRCISDFQQAHVSKTADRRAKRSKLWASGVNIQCIQGTFDTYVVKVILRAFGAFPFSTIWYLESGLS